MIVVEQIYTHSPLRNYTYLVYSTKSGEAVSIDPYSADPIIHFLKQKNLKLKSILNTHEHGDHTAGNLELKSHTNCKIYGHTRAKDIIPGIDDVLKEGDIAFQNESEVLLSWDTPGHTFSHLSFVWKNPSEIKGVFTGDTLFNAGVGNCFRGGDVKTLYHTIQTRFETLPGSVLLFPGHDYMENNLKFSIHMEAVNPKRELFEKELKSKTIHFTNFEIERNINPFFRRNSEQIKKKILESTIENESKLTDEMIFFKLRELRDHW